MEKDKEQENLSMGRLVDRVYYYSKADLSTGHNLDMAEKRIKDIENVGMPDDLEGVIELWIISRMFSDDCRLTRWSDLEYNELKGKTKSYKAFVARYFSSLDPAKVKGDYVALNWGYKDAFWQIISQLKCFNAIHPSVMREIIQGNLNDLRSVLQNSDLVEKYKVVIREVLLDSKKGAVILLDKFVSKKQGNDEDEINLPSNLSVQERENIISEYLDGDDPNLNYVRLIGQAKNISDHFVLSAKIKLKAERLEQELNAEILKDPKAAVTHRKMEVSFSDDENAKIKTTSSGDGCMSYTYSTKYLLKCTVFDRVGYLAKVFNWFNEHGMLNLINKPCEVEALETAFMDKGRDAYPDYCFFRHKNELAFFQLLCYSQVLDRNGSSAEDILKVFYREILKKDFAYPGLQLELPKSEMDWLAKCRIIFPELDKVARQYDVYVEEDEIDARYMTLLGPQKLRKTKSLLENKYVEVNNQSSEIRRVMDYLFNSNSLLGYVEPFREKHYYSLAKLMANEIVCYDYFEEYQRPKVDFLVESGILVISEDGVVRYKDNSAIEVLDSIREFEAASYWHFCFKGRRAADEMIAKGWLVTDGHLLSKAERQYFSFYMDNAEFTNGYAYRNLYAHGNTPPADDINKHVTAYYALLRLLFILVIKIYDDLYLAEKALYLRINRKK